VLVAGGGISGCAAAQELQSRHVPYILAERNADLGGLTRSIRLGDAVFDYTGHFLHLAHYRSPAEIPHAGLRDDDWARVERRAAALIEGTFVPAPVQYHLGCLPGDLADRCIASYRDRRRHGCPSDFADYLARSFGETVCEVFLHPYNRKLLAVDPTALCPTSAGRFLPPPDEERIEPGYSGLEPTAPGETPGPREGTGSGLEPTTEGYNSRYWYPREQGIGLLAEGLARRLEGVRTHCPVQAVELGRRLAITPRGSVGYDRMLTSIPLRELCLMCDDPELRDLGAGLSHNRVLSLNILARAALPEPLDTLHWVYLPDPAIPIYRVGVYSNVSPALVPAGHVALYAEMSRAHTDPLPGAGRAARVAMEALESLGWLSPGSVVAIAANWIEVGYVHFLHDREERVSRILERLSEHGVTPVGRYGRWDYISMEDSIRQGLDAALEVARA
jgi:protoporphyrinogen oxidase